MFYVIGNKVYSATYDEDNSRYPLVSVAMAADGAVTITDEGEGIATIPAPYRKCTLEEVIAIFAIVAGGKQKPYATISGNDPVTVYLDEASKAATLTIAKPSAGDFSLVASSNTGIATVSEADGVFTIVPVAAGMCNITAKWTPTDTDFAASTVTIPVMVVRRKVEIAQVREQNLTKNVAKTIVLQPNINSIAYTALSSDTGICAVAITGGTGHEHDLVLTPAASAPLGKCKITVSAVESNGKADDSDVMEFWVNVCNSAVSITAIDDQTVEAGKSKEITVTCAGAEIREITTSDASHVTVEKTAKLKFKVTAVGEAEDAATVTVYCDKRGYGEDSEDLTVTIS